MRLTALFFIVLLLSSCTTIALDQKLVFGGSYRSKDLKLQSSSRQTFVFFHNRSGRTLEGILFETTGATSNTILFPGNGGLGGGYKDFFIRLSEATNTNLFIPNYQGYGYSDGVTDVDQLLDDGVDSIKYLQDQTSRELPLYILGYSIGSYNAIHLGSSTPNSGVGLVAPFSKLESVWEMTKGNYVPFFVLPFVRFQFDPKLSRMSNIEDFRRITNVIVVAGSRDSVFPLQIVNELVLGNPSSQLKVIDNATHQSLMEQDLPIVIKEIGRLYK